MIAISPSLWLMNNYHFKVKMPLFTHLQWKQESHLKNIELNVNSYRKKKDGGRESERKGVNLGENILSQISLHFG